MPTALPHLLLTGTPGVGKTTVLKKLAERLGDCELWSVTRVNRDALAGRIHERLAELGVLKPD